MDPQIEKRLNELRAEYETGQKKLQELETEQQSWRDMLERINGAIEVLEELLAEDAAKEAGAN